MTRRIPKALNCSFRLYASLALMLVLFTPSAMPRQSDDPPQPPSPPSPTAEPSSTHELLRPKDRKAIDKWGEITIAQPKIWQYERVNALLDGLLRDVEGVSLADLTQLNPSSQNAAAIRFIQSALGVAVQYDQAAQTNAANLLQNWKDQHEGQVAQLNQYNTYLATLQVQRDQLTSQLFAANNTVLTLQSRQDANGQLPPDQANQLKAAQDRAGTLQTQLNQVNSMITGAGAAPTLTAPPTLQSTTAQLPTQPALSSFADILKSLPDGVQKGLTSALQSPSYPATKQLDNFIALLHERLAREIAVQQDDLMRDPDSLPFLLQFDVGLYPSRKTKNHMARVEFELQNCPGCKVYSLYPGQSSYNVANYQGASRRRNFFGNLATLIGLGISASYQRQEDSLQGSLVQSVYVSGFQDDMENKPDEAGRGVAQRFGWYYGAAPFDQYVTPGIRSAFALITVPRKAVKCFLEASGQDCRPKAANDSAKPKLDSPGSSGGRKTASRGTKKAGADPAMSAGAESHASFLYVNQSDSGDQAAQGRDPSLQNNTGSSGPELQTRTSRRTNPNQPYTISLQVKANWAKRDDPFYQKSHWYKSKTYLGNGHKSELRKELEVALPGTDNLNSLSRALPNDKERLHVLRMEYNTVTVKNVAATPPPSPAQPAPAPQAASGLNVCPKHECASVLLSLDVPIDPNLVVTVHGNVLPRVRDWRGRATSILPPVQSTSDLAPPPSGGSQSKSQNPVSRSLLEADQLQADCWFAVTSHDLLLNISHWLAGEEEFPVIQLSVPGKQTLVIPNDLRQNVTEIITGGFRFLPSDQIYDHIVRAFGRRTDHPGQTRLAMQDAQGGPFPYATFLPLFQRQPAAKQFYAFVGQTGHDLIIGFLNGPQDAMPQKRYSFLEARTLAILEDPDLDLAWPLPCENQGEELICHMPTTAIRQGYTKDVAAVCAKDADCPSIDSRIAHLRDPHAPFVSGLQVWVEQYDPQGDNSFWSAEPAKIGLFPLSEDFTPQPSKSDAVYKPWHFCAECTENDHIGIEECNYFASATPQETIKIRYLTPVDFLEKPKDMELKDSDQNKCSHIQLPTSTLASQEIVLQISVGTRSAWTAAIPTAPLKPEFKAARVHQVVGRLTGASGSFGVTAWEAWIPVIRMYCTDEIEELGELHDIKVQWLDGDVPASRSLPCPEAWWAKQQTGQIRLHLTIPKSAADHLPETLHLVRATSSGVKVRVAEFKDFRGLILPSKLKVEPLGDSQFALRGHNAGAIDGVALQYRGKTRVYPAGSGGNFAVVDITPPPAPKSNSKPAAQKSAKQPPTAKNKKDTTASAGADTGLAAGTYAVLPLIWDEDRKTYVPLEVTDESGSPLVFTKKAATTPDKPAANPDETITITKTTTKAAATGAAGGTVQQKQ